MELKLLKHDDCSWRGKQQENDKLSVDHWGKTGSWWNNVTYSEESKCVNNSLPSWYKVNDNQSTSLYDEGWQWALEM